MESWPFKVVDDNGNPKVEVEYLGKSHTFSPQEISAMVLVKVSPGTEQRALPYALGRPASSITRADGGATE